MKEPTETEPQNTSQRECEFSILLSAETADRLERIARAKAMPVERIIQELTMNYVAREADPVQARIGRGVELVKGLIEAGRDELMLVSTAGAIAGTRPFQERQHKRDRLAEMGLQAFEELVKISDSEQIAKQSQFRLRAFLVLARVGAFTDAVIHNQDEADLLDLIEQLEQAEKKFEEELKKIKARESELEKARSSTG